MKEKTLKGRIRKRLAFAFAVVMVFTAVAAFLPAGVLTAKADGNRTVTVNKFLVTPNSDGTYLYELQWDVSGLDGNTKYSLCFYNTSSSAVVEKIGEATSDAVGNVGFDIEKTSSNLMDNYKFAIIDAETESVEILYNNVSIVTVQQGFIMEASDIADVNDSYGTYIPEDLHGVTYGTETISAVVSSGINTENNDAIWVFSDEKKIPTFSESVLDESGLEEGYFVDGWIYVAVDYNSGNLLGSDYVDFEESVDLSQYSISLSSQVGLVVVLLFPNVVNCTDINETELSQKIIAEAGNEPVVSLTCDGESLAEETDYTLEYYSDEECTQAIEDITSVLPGTYYVKITGTGEYMNSRVEEITITEVVYDILDGADLIIANDYEGEIVIRCAGELDLLEAFGISNATISDIKTCWRTSEDEKESVAPFIATYTGKFCYDTGSTILTIPADFVAALPAGTYTLRFIYTNGYGETTLTKLAAVTNTQEDDDAADDTDTDSTSSGGTDTTSSTTTTASPKTGETSMAWMTFLMILSAGFGVYGVYRRRRA